MNLFTAEGRIEIDGVQRAFVASKGNTAFAVEKSALEAINAEVRRCADGASVYYYAIIKRPNGCFYKMLEGKGTVQGGVLEEK